MSVLGDKLKRLVELNKINVYQVAKRAGIDRSTIHKVMTSDRFPSEEFMTKLANAMPITPDERKDLWQAYEIQRIGEYRYNQRIQVKNIIEVMDTVKNMPNLQRYIDERINDFCPKDLEIIHGGLFVEHLIADIINYEAKAAKDPEILFCMPHDGLSFLEVLFFKYINSDRLKVKCIFEFTKNKDDGSKINRNLDILRAIMPFVLHPGDRFEGYYVYENFAAVKTSLTPMPYYIITSEFIVTLTSDIKTAVLYRRPELIDCYRSIFTNALEGSLPLLRRVQSLEEIAHHFFSVLPARKNEADARIHTMESQPCLAKYFTADIIERHLVPEMVSRETSFDKNVFVAGVSAYYRAIEDLLSNGVIPFTEKGVGEFVNSGRLLYVPKQCALPFTVTERIHLIDCMIEDIGNDVMFYRLTNNSKFRPPECTFIDVFSGMALNIMSYYPQNPGVMNIVFIEEESIVNAFDDFLVGLKDSDLLCSKEATLELLKKMRFKLENMQEE